MSSAHNIKRYSMERAAAIVDFVRYGSRPNIAQVAEKFNCHISTARATLNMFVSMKKLTRIRGKKAFEVGAPDVFVIGEDKTAIEIPAKMARVRIEAKEDHYQKTVPAQQIGMTRDPLIAALFGEVR